MRLRMRLVPASVFTARDLPEAEPGKPVWGGVQGWGITYYDKWVYAVSTTENILQFECDPVTAQLTYKGATPLGYHNKDSAKHVTISSWIRHAGDNQDKLVLFYGDHNKGLSWYGINKSSGRLIAEGKQVPVVKCDHHNSTQLVMPDGQHFCYGGRYEKTIDWYRFGDDGIPVADGSFALKNFGVGSQSPCVMASPDWKHMYYLMFSEPVRDDPTKDITPQIDTYAIDPKTHAGAYVSSLKLPVPAKSKGRVSGALEPFSPDGKFTYAIFRARGFSYYYVLARDPNSGALSLASQNPNAKAGDLGNLTGAPWSRQDRFAYTKDGQSGFFVNNGPVERFSRDPATGVLTLLPPIPDMGARKLALDPVNGNLFTVGEKIASFKVAPGNQ